MMRRTALLSWAIGALGLTLALVFSDHDFWIYAGGILVLLGPLVALGAVVRRRTPATAVVFLLSLVPQVILGFVLYQDALNGQ